MQRWLRSFGNNWNIIRVSLSNIVSFLWPKCPWIKWVVTQTAIQQRYINSYKNILINNQNASSVRPSDPDRSFYNQRQREWQQKGKLFSLGKKKEGKREEGEGGGGLIYGCCTPGAENRGRLFGGGGCGGLASLSPGFSERVSQLPQAAASSTPTGLAGAGGSGRRSLSGADGHVSIRYSSISWWQLLTTSCNQNYREI